MAKKMSTAELRGMLAAEKADSLSAVAASKLTEERATAMQYYLGEMPDMKGAEGRSQAVSRDVADTVEGMMPQLMEIFAGDEVVRFDAVGPEDVQAAQQETDYVNHVFMQQNPGFLTLYSMIKDALLSKTGIVKVFWDEGEEVNRETYYDLDDATYQLLVADPEVEIVEHTERSASVDDGGSGAVPSGLPGAMLGGAQVPNGASGGQPAVPGMAAAPDDGLAQTLHDVTVQTRKNYEQAKVEAVPPEEFGIARNARSIQTAGYCFHDVIRRQEDLIADGYDEDQIKELNTYTGLTNTETQSRDTVEERNGVTGSDTINRANRLVKVTEHYVRMDYEGTGNPGLYRVVTGGDGGNQIILEKDGKPVIVREGMMPFAAITPIIQTHRFFGRSIADLVLDIQRIKTALFRGLLDNQYAHNNPRPIVAEAGASESTLDDLLIMRAGQPIRVRDAGAIEWTQVPDITQSLYPALQYMDATREWRTGVSRQGQGIDPEALQNQVATIANQMEQASTAKIKLIARIFAETGIKDLFLLLHGIIRKNGTQAQTVRLRNQWVTVDPRDWKKRNDMTINVGLGTGSKAQQLAGLQLLIGAQTQAVALGMVSKKNFYNSAQDLCKLTGHQDAEQYFVKPGSPVDPQDPDSAPLPPPPDPKAAELQGKMALSQAELQGKQQIETIQAQADAAVQKQKVDTEGQLQLVKTQAEIARDERDAERKAQMMAIEHEFKMRELQAESDRKQQEFQMRLHDHTLASESKQQDHHFKMAQSRAKAAESGNTLDEQGNMSAHPEVKQGFSELVRLINEKHDEAIKAAKAPRKTTLVRDPKTGRATGAISTAE